jgi:hypothetical protein
MVMRALAVVVFRRHIGGAPSNTATVGVVVLTVVAPMALEADATILRFHGPPVA